MLASATEIHEVLVQGKPVTYQVAGEGEPVLLVHGLSGSMRWWGSTLPALAVLHRVYGIDLPGFGTLARSHQFVLEEAASWLVAWLDAVGLQAVDLVGHSMGGHICLRVAVDYPNAVRHLVLAAPSGIPDQRSIPVQLLDSLEGLRHVPASFLSVIAADAVRAGPARLWQAFLDIVDDNILPHLERLTVPTLLIWGSQDRLVPLELGRQLRQHMPGSRLLVLPGVGHLPMVEAPEKFNPAVLRFLSGEPVGH